MFTILAKYTKSKREVLLQARSVEYIPVGDDVVSPGLLLVGIEGDEGRSTHLGKTPPGDEDFRDVFVMNAAGQTVGRYAL